MNVFSLFILTLLSWSGKVDGITTYVCERGQTPDDFQGAGLDESVVTITPDKLTWDDVRNRNIVL